MGHVSASVPSATNGRGMSMASYADPRPKGVMTLIQKTPASIWIPGFMFWSSVLPSSWRYGWKLFHELSHKFDLLLPSGTVSLVYLTLGHGSIRVFSWTTATALLWLMNVAHLRDFRARAIRMIS